MNMNLTLNMNFEEYIRIQYTYGIPRNTLDDSKIKVEWGISISKDPQWSYKLLIVVRDITFLTKESQS